MGQTELNCVLLYPRCTVGSEYGILTESAGSDRTLLRVRAGWDILFDALERQFLKAFHTNRSEGHVGLVVAPALSLSALTVFFLGFDPLYQLEISRQEKKRSV